VAATVLTLYAGLLFWAASQGALQLITGNWPGVYDLPATELRAASAQSLLIGFCLGWLLTVLARGLYHLRPWAWLSAVAIWTCIALFYLLNCLAYRWFTPWLLQIPAVFVTLLLSSPVMLPHLIPVYDTGHDAPRGQADGVSPE
jgi:hypothetical protein